LCYWKDKLPPWQLAENLVLLRNDRNLREKEEHSMPKAIFTAALTGGIHTPTMSPYLPITPDQLAEHAIAAHEAGAAVAHVHVRNPETGMPTPDLELF